MNNNTARALDPQTQAETIAAIVALNWSVDPVTQPLQIIQEHFGVAWEEAVDLFIGFQRRNLIICRPERPANNFAETGIVAPPIRSRWIEPDASMR